MGKQKKKERKQRISHHTVLLTTLLSALVVLVAGALIFLNASSLENGILDICANQQDAYVQLVLDQINLVDDREEEEIINNILATLDASSNKYWTLDKQESLIFVKDVSETNKYKGFTTASYYVTESAHQFLEQLKLNRVTHSVIQMKDKVYVASGVTFLYRGDSYRLCLLTNRDVILDHNDYMSVRINLSLLALVLLAFFFLLMVFLARAVEKWKRAYDDRERDNIELRGMVQRLSDEVTKTDLYDTKRALFHEQLVPTMLQKLEKRGAYPIDMILLQYDSPEVRERFLLVSQTMLDRQVLRFRIGEEHILLICIKCLPLSVDTALATTLEPGIRVVAHQWISEDRGIALEEYYKILLKKAGWEERTDGK